MFGGKGKKDRDKEDSLVNVALRRSKISIIVFLEFERIRCRDRCESAERSRVGWSFYETFGTLTVCL